MGSYCSAGEVQSDFWEGRPGPSIVKAKRSGRAVLSPLRTETLARRTLARERTALPGEGQCDTVITVTSGRAGRAGHLPSPGQRCHGRGRAPWRLPRRLFVTLRESILASTPRSGPKGRLVSVAWGSDASSSSVHEASPALGSAGLRGRVRPQEQPARPPADWSLTSEGRPVPPACSKLPVDLLIVEH